MGICYIATPYPKPPSDPKRGVKKKNSTATALKFIHLLIFCY